MSEEQEPHKTFRERFHPKELLTVSAITGASGFFIQPTLGGNIARGMHKAIEYGDSDVTKVIGAGAISLIVTVSVAVEHKTLEKYDVSGSGTASMLYEGTGRPVLSSFLSHGASLAQFYGLNPATWYAVIHGDPQIALESAGATLVAAAGLRTVYNTAALVIGKERLTNIVRATRESVAGRFRKSV